MPEGDAAAAAIRAGFEQRIFHARNLFLHGLERLADHGGTNPLRAQIANFLDLYEIEKRILVCSRNQSRLLPGLELARNEPKNTEQLGAAISIHGCQLCLCAR